MPAKPKSPEEENANDLASRVCIESTCSARWFLEGWVRLYLTKPEVTILERKILRRADGNLIPHNWIMKKIRKAIERHNHACYRAGNHDDCIYDKRQTSAWRNRE
jgi:hypothetical protein